MHTITAKDAKNNFGHLIDQARHEPVAISRHGRDVAIVLAVEDYEKMQRAASWGRLQNIEGSFSTQDLAEKHKISGADMYFIDDDTPRGMMKRMSADGRVDLISVSEFDGS